MSPLWHFTCDHGRQALGGKSWLLPANQLLAELPPSPLGKFITGYVWLTDRPDGSAAGLEGVRLTCDRTAHRYRVTGDLRAIRRWADVPVPLNLRRDLENTPGLTLDPGSWWVSAEPVLAVYDPAWVSA